MRTSGRPRKLARAAMLTALMGALLLGQSSDPPLTFEVASIKPSSADEHRVALMIQPGGGFRASGATLKTLLTLAYNVREFQISGGPNWIGSERYDITARAERAAGGDAANDQPGGPDAIRKMTDEQRKTLQQQMAQRLQALLADRFQLVVRRETKEQQVYALVVGKGGAKIHPSEAKADARQGMMRMSRGFVEGQDVPLDTLIQGISGQLGRPVVDRTGLTGRFDIKLQWTPDPGQAASQFAGGPPPGVELPPSDPNGPSLFTALQEQLGLRLESQKAPVDLIVIEKVEKPTEN